MSAPLLPLYLTPTFSCGTSAHASQATSRDLGTAPQRPRRKSVTKDIGKSKSVLTNGNLRPVSRRQSPDAALVAEPKGCRPFDLVRNTIGCS